MDIKEGDIIERCWDNGMIRKYLIRMKDNKLISDPWFDSEKKIALVFGNKPPIMKDAPTMLLSEVDMSNTRVIGNRKDNPELMGVSI